MVETTLAAGDLITAIPTLYAQLRLPFAVIALAVAAIAGAFALNQGVGKALGKVVGGIAIAALIFAGLGLAQSIQRTVNNRTGVSIGEYGW